VHTVNQDWIGVWLTPGSARGCTSLLIVDADSEYRFSRSGNSECSFSADGTLKIRGDKLKMWPYRFRIIEHPVQLVPGDSFSAGYEATYAKNWRMQIECSNMYCHTGKLTFYKE
jgi:hypothetical protein